MVDNSKHSVSYDPKKERAQLGCVFFVITAAIFCIGVTVGCVCSLSACKVPDSFIELLKWDLVPFLTLGFGKAGSAQINDFIMARINKLAGK